MTDTQPPIDSFTGMSHITRNRAAARLRVYARTWHENQARSLELADVPFVNLAAADWDELEALLDYMNDYPTAADVDRFERTLGDNLGRYAYHVVLALTVMAVVCAVIGFLAGAAYSAPLPRTGFDKDVTFRMAQSCDGYTLTATPAAGAVAGDVYVWGDATDTPDPTMRKIGTLTTTPVVRTLTRGPGTYSGGMSIHYPNGTESNRSYTIIVQPCVPTEPTGPIVGPPIIITVPPTFATIAPPSTAVPMCEDFSPPMAGPCPTTTTTSAAPTSTPSPTEGPSGQPTTSPTPSPRVFGEVVTSPTTADGTPTDETTADTLPHTGAGNTTVRIAWAAVLAVFVGLFLVCVRNWGPADTEA